MRLVYRAFLLPLLAVGCNMTTPAIEMASHSRPEPPATTQRVTHPAYPAFIRQIESQRERMMTLYQGGQLDLVYAPAEQVGQLAKHLPTLVGDLPYDQQVDVRMQVQNLQGLFMPVTVASKNLDKQATLEAIQAYDAPIAALKRYM